MSDAVTQTPDWLVDRMDKISKLPPPTLEEVRMQFDGSSNQKESKVIIVTPTMSRVVKSAGKKLWQIL